MLCVHAYAHCTVQYNMICVFLSGIYMYMYMSLLIPNNCAKTIHVHVHVYNVYNLHVQVVMYVYISCFLLSMCIVLSMYSGTSL